LRLATARFPGNLGSYAQTSPETYRRMCAVMCGKVGGKVGARIVVAVGLAVGGSLWHR
jgi:hypothetical protein